MTPDDLARAARSLVGVPFRPYGRDPASGLDCLGVLLAARGLPLTLPGRPPLRSRRPPATAETAAALGFEPAAGPMRAGDVVLTRPGALQHHIAIATAPDRFVHAHAGLRRVVESPLPDAWPVAGHWRLPDGDD